MNMKISNLTNLGSWNLLLPNAISYAVCLRNWADAWLVSSYSCEDIELSIMTQ